MCLRAPLTRDTIYTTKKVFWLQNKEYALRLRTGVFGLDYLCIGIRYGWMCLHFL